MLSCHNQPARDAVLALITCTASASQPPVEPPYVKRAQPSPMPRNLMGEKGKGDCQ
jgi:hypothetical protein